MRPGVPEIPDTVFEELLVNALVHRDYLVSAPIRLFIFDNRIEIISPGHLPNNLTVEKIRAAIPSYGIRFWFPMSPRGCCLTTASARGSSGRWRSGREIDFIDDREGCLFTATVHRKEINGAVAEISSQKTWSKQEVPRKFQKSLTHSRRTDNHHCLPRSDVGITDRAIKNSLKGWSRGANPCIGPDKGGHWRQ